MAQHRALAVWPLRQVTDVDYDCAAVVFLLTIAEGNGDAVAVSAYKIWAVGPRVGNSATNPLHVGVAGIAKSNVPGPPTTVANELVCSRLASVLLLPTPPGFLIDHNGSPHFVSLNFNLAGHSLPPVNGAEMVAAHPELSWGIVLFDMWILNSDRHSQNVAYDKSTNAVQIFDHSHALFARGRQQMTLNSALPGIGGHCIAQHLTSLAGLDVWCARIASLPDFFVRTSVKDVADPQFGVTPDDATFCADWLLDRRGKLKSIVLANQAAFPKISAADWSAAVPQPVAPVSVPTALAPGEGQ